MFEFDFATPGYSWFPPCHWMSMEQRRECQRGRDRDSRQKMAREARGPVVKASSPNLVRHVFWKRFHLDRSLQEEIKISCNEN